MQEIIIKCWSDPEFKSQFMNDPLTVLNKYGFSLPEGLKQLNVVENTPDTAYFVIPAAPDMAELSEKDIRDVAQRALATQLVLPTILD